MENVTLKAKPKTFNLPLRLFMPTPQRMWAGLKGIGLSLISIAIFVLSWYMGASYLFQIEVSARLEKARTEQGEQAAQALAACIQSGDIKCRPNTLPSPLQVWTAAQTLMTDHFIISQKKADFQAKVAKTNANRAAKGLSLIRYTGRPSFLDQIQTSIITVFAGFLIAILIAIPLGVLLGLNRNLHLAFNWFVQIFKPVSPVVWLLLVFMIIKTLTLNSDMDTSFLISSISVGLCAMWATMINTSVGVSSVSQEYLNVAKVLRLSLFKKIFKVILPSSIPLIFTGMRITLSVAWMVLIAIELLAQSPGLGSFVWEEFQNGANDSNAKIIVAMFVIGMIGFLLDRVMFYIQRSVSFEKVRS